MPKCSCPSCHPQKGEAKSRGRLRYDWAEIQRYHDEGHGFIECSRRFAITHTAWNKAISTGRLRTVATPYKDRRKRYDWAEIQTYYDQGHTYRQCQLEFGFCAAAWNKARKRGEIKARRLGVPLEVLLGRRGSRHAVKARLLREGLIRNQCDECGLSEWQGKPLSIHIDHINGIRDDHRLENLRMLCPNCHSQTDTYGARNKGRWSLQDRPRSV
jgi:hypothetical protein